MTAKRGGKNRKQPFNWDSFIKNVTKQSGANNRKPYSSCSASNCSDTLSNYSQIDNKFKTKVEQVSELNKDSIASLICQVCFVVLL